MSISRSIRVFYRRKLLLCHSQKQSKWAPLQTLQISKWAPLSWFEAALIKTGAFIKFFSYEEGRLFQEGVNLGRRAFLGNYGIKARIVNTPPKIGVPYLVFGNVTDSIALTKKFSYCQIFPYKTPSQQKQNKWRETVKTQQQNHSIKRKIRESFSLSP